MKSRICPSDFAISFFRACDQRAEVKGVQRLVLQRLRHVARNDATGQAFDDGGLADARLADQHRVVFRAPREDLDRAPDFLVASDDRVELSGPGRRRQVAPVFLEGLVAVLGVVAGDVLLAVLLDGILDLAFRQAELAARRLHVVAAVADDADQKVLGGDEIVFHARGFRLGFRHDARRVHAHRQPVLPFDAGNLPEKLLQPCAKHREVRVRFLEDRRQKPFGLFDQRQQQMRRRDFLMVMERGGLLRRLQGFQGFLRIFFRSHDVSLLYKYLLVV